MPTKTKKKSNEDSGLNDCVADVITRLGDLSYRMEEARYEALLSASSRILTCISIISIALITLLGVIIDVLEEYMLLIGIAYLSTFSLLVASFVVALIAQIRFKYKELQSPKNLSDHIVKSLSEFEGKIEVPQFYCNCIEDSHNSLKIRSDKICSMIGASTILLIVSMGIVLLWVLSISVTVFFNL